MEARVRIELTRKGFADLSLTTWVPRRDRGAYSVVGIWSGKRDSNPRLRPWQGRTLPLSYSRPYAALARFVASDRFSYRKNYRKGEQALSRTDPARGCPLP